MAADLLFSLSETFLNRSSQSVFPTLQPKMSRSESVPAMNLKVTWGVSAPPQFKLSGGGQTFTLTMPLDITITPDGKSPQKGTSNVTANCRANIVGTGSLQFSAAELSFDSGDAFLKAVLNAKKDAIAAQFNAFLSAISINLAIVNGVSFTGYAVLVGHGYGTAAGGLSLPVTIPTPAPSSDFAVYLSEGIIQKIVEQTFWKNVQKTYQEGPAEADLTGYEAGLLAGHLHMTLHMSGNYKSAGAVWKITIDDVDVSLNIAIANGHDLAITGGDVSRPGVTVSADNWVAWIYKILGGLITSYIVEAIVGRVIGGKIQDSIRANLNRTLLSIPGLTGNFEGVAVTVTPKDLTVAVQDKQIVLTGNADLTAR